MRAWNRQRSLLAASAALLALAACDSLTRSDDLSASFDPGQFDGNPNTPQVPGGSAGTGSTTNPRPGVETEVESSYRAPVVTGKYVWSANSASGRVALIDAETFEVKSVDAGFGPTQIAALERADAVPRALVINSLGHDATLLELAADGSIRTQRAALHEGADSWSISPDGRFAIAWSDSRNLPRADATDGFQDVSVLELGASGSLSATRLTVGYRPSAFAFDAGSGHAYGITQDGVSVITLEAGAVRLSGLVPLPSLRGVQPDVSVLPDGTRALARIEGSDILYDIDLVAGGITEHRLAGRISDLDLSADGSTAVAIVQRPAGEPAQPGDAGAGSDAGAGDDAGAVTPALPGSEAVFIPIPAGLASAAARRSLSRANESFGSVALAQDGKHAVLFTTSQSTGRVTLVGPELEGRSVDLIAAVRAVFITADGSHALALQTPPQGSVKRGAFSVIALDTVRSPKLVASDAPAQAVALSPASSERALVTVSDPVAKVYGAFLVRLPSLQVDFGELPSLPLATGIIPAASKGFVAQEHPEGRITFIDLAEGVGREITGFELSSKVVNQ